MTPSPRAELREVAREAELLTALARPGETLDVHVTSARSRRWTGHVEPADRCDVEAVVRLTDARTEAYAVLDAARGIAADRLLASLRVLLPFGSPARRRAAEGAIPGPPECGHRDLTGLRDEVSDVLTATGVPPLRVTATDTVGEQLFLSSDGRRYAHRFRFGVIEAAAKAARGAFGVARSARDLGPDDVPGLRCEYAITASLWDREPVPPRAVTTVLLTPPAAAQLLTLLVTAGANARPAGGTGPARRVETEAALLDDPVAPGSPLSAAFDLDGCATAARPLLDGAGWHAPTALPAGPLRPDPRSAPGQGGGNARRRRWDVTPVALPYAVRAVHSRPAAPGPGHQVLAYQILNAQSQRSGTSHLVSARLALAEQRDAGAVRAGTLLVEATPLALLRRIAGAAAPVAYREDGGIACAAQWLAMDLSPGDGVRHCSEE